MIRSDVIAGEKYGRLTALHETDRVNGKKAWLCRCECGRECVVLAERLAYGTTRSCGCLKHEAVAKMRACKKPGWVQKQIATRMQNANANNYSGKKGVLYHPKSGTFEAQIKIDYKTRYIGTYRTRDEAEAARKAVERVRITAGSDAAIAFIKQIRQAQIEARTAAKAAADAEKAAEQEQKPE